MSIKIINDENIKGHNHPCLKLSDYNSFGGVNNGLKINVLFVKFPTGGNPLRVMNETTELA